MPLTDLEKIKIMWHLPKLKCPLLQLYKFRFSLDTYLEPTFVALDLLVISTISQTKLNTPEISWKFMFRAETAADV